MYGSFGHRRYTLMPRICRILCPWRTEERTQDRTVIDLGNGGAIFGSYRKVGSFKCKNGSIRHKNEAGRVGFDLLERQLHILIVVVIVQVLSQVMHGKEVGEGDFAIERLVLGEMPEKQRHLVYLAQRSRIQDYYQ